MPDAILLFDPHVTHLHRQKIFEHGLPYSAAKTAIFSNIHTGRFNSAEVKLQILIAQECSPSGWRAREHFGKTTSLRNALQVKKIFRLVRTVEFNNRDLFLLRMIANLRNVNHRVVLPSSDCMRRNNPFDGACCRVCGHK